MTNIVQAYDIIRQAHAGRLAARQEATYKAVAEALAEFGRSTALTYSQRVELAQSVARGITDSIEEGGFDEDDFVDEAVS